MESKKQFPLLKIERDKYWDIVYSCLSKKTKESYEDFGDWFESDNSVLFSHLVDYRMGLRICREDEDGDFYGDEDYHSVFYFNVIDQEKCLWARLKYGI